MITEFDIDVIQGRECGNCTLCCKVIGVPEIDKPRGQWCKHCDSGKGCEVYFFRPAACREWFCGWRTLPFLTDDWFPAKAKMVCNPIYSGDRVILSFIIDPAFPGRWREKRWNSRLRELARKFAVQVYDGERCWTILPNGDARLSNGGEKMSKTESVGQGRRRG